MEAGSPKSPAPDSSASSAASSPPARPPVNKSWLAAQGKLPLSFMGLGLAWLAAAVALMVLRPDILLEGHTSPHVIALAHAWVLGFFTTVATGAVYQIVPVALSTKLWNEPLGWLHFGCHLVGVPGMVVAFWFYRLDLVGMFGALTALGILFFALNTCVTVKLSPRHDIIARSILLAAGWLAVGALAGLFLVANRLWAWTTLDTISLLRAHAHLGAVGFFITLIQGVGFQLIPMFTLGQVTSWRAARIGIWCSQAGLLLLLPGLLWRIRALEVVAALVITVGLISSGLGMRRALRTRKKMRLDPGVVVFLWGVAGLILTACAGVVLAGLGASRGGAVGGFNPMIYALLGLFAGLLPCVTGMMCKVVPFLTWMRAYGPLVGRFRTPPAHSLTRPWLERWGLALQQLAVIPLLLGAWRLDLAWSQWGAWLLAAGVLLFLTDMLGILKHLWRRQEMEPLHSAFHPKPAS